VRVVFVASRRTRGRGEVARGTAGRATTSSVDTCVTPGQPGSSRDRPIHGVAVTSRSIQSRRPVSS